MSFEPLIFVLKWVSYRHLKFWCWFVFPSICTCLLFSWWIVDGLFMYAGRRTQWCVCFWNWRKKFMTWDFSDEHDEGGEIWFPERVDLLGFVFTWCMVFLEEALWLARRFNHAARDWSMAMLTKHLTLSLNKTLSFVLSKMRQALKYTIRFRVEASSCVFFVLSSYTYHTLAMPFHTIFHFFSIMKNPYLFQK